MPTDRLPKWLYLKRESEHDVIWRFGSRRPLRVCLTIIRDRPGAWPRTSAVLACLGRLGLAYGPEDGITEGAAGLPRGSKTRFWFRPNGKTLAISWEGSGAD